MLACGAAVCSGTRFLDYLAICLTLQKDKHNGTALRAVLLAMTAAAVLVVTAAAAMAVTAAVTAAVVVML